jgi:NAD(P)-dependent dehydrogenase (short-subunit alcohol dehydrogenase family)
MMRLNEKVAIITGSASGIGRATALLFASEGAAVVVADLDEVSGLTVTLKIMEWDGQAIFVRGDVSRADDCRRIVQETIDTFGRLDIVVNSAGIIRRANVLDTAEEEWDRVMAVNAKSVFLMAKYSVPVMAGAGGGTIVNIGSGWGLAGGRKAVSYCASKAAVVNMTRAMALDHGEQNIRVNCVCPGDTDTPMLREEARQLGQPDNDFLVEAANRPLQRVGTPQDIAQAVVYLASDAASFVTGTTLVVDGGGLAG